MHGAGCDGVHSDAEWRDFESDAARVRLNRRLAGTVRYLPAEGLGVVRAEVDYPPGRAVPCAVSLDVFGDHQHGGTHIDGKVAVDAAVRG